ncbi:hypothetical protein FQN55_006074 [Onygenales sp. PD_40]|nr:hypothetical protein FQN55_006074 [Onygenales sp. PD_40]KAK2770467.1 hypothetical protein FQN53_005526 [Emmonsiellopsis sp. PD_33]KAK2778656.1 hypothetical protein FQN52_002690 [Onygenales sp. PD_12]KAK2788345.1 hypothetical protein FQN51_002933 [Onygenales sp. PD_10]
MGLAEHPYGNRRRRSALIPSGVCLSPEEEALLVGRIGYRPIPPPDSIRSDWLSPHLEDTKTDGAGKSKVWGPEEDLKEEEAVRKWVDAQKSPDRAKDRFARGRELSMPDEESVGSGKQTEDPTVYAATVKSDNPKNELPSRPPPPPMKIDIPHMSEVKSLKTIPRRAPDPTPPPPATWALGQNEGVVSPSRCVFNSLVPETDVSPRDLSGTA